MRWLLVLIFCCFAFVSAAEATEGRVIKVLPQFIDTHGQNTLSPSLYDRDAYQKYLRVHPAKQGGLRFAIQWKAKVPENKPLKLKVELRGVAHGDLPKEAILQDAVTRSGWFSQWSYLTLSGDTFHEFGEMTAWRVTLWDGDQLLGEQKSFLW